MESRDLFSNVHQIQLLYPCFMLLIGQNLSKAVSRHFGCRNPLYVKLFVLYFLPKPVLMNVDMLKLGVKLWCILL